VLKDVRINDQPRGDRTATVGMDEFATDLVRIETLAWIVTSSRMRESFSVRWRGIVPLEALSPSQAREAFVEIAGYRFAGDPLLDEIINLSALTPGALDLLARDARRNGTLQPLVERYTTTDFSVVDESTNTRADRAMARALTLALRGPHLSNAAGRLARVAAIFPDGVAHTDVEKIVGVPIDAARELSEQGLMAPSTKRCRLYGAVARVTKLLFPPLPADLEAIDHLYQHRVETLAPRAGISGGDIAVQELTPDMRNIDASLRRRLADGDRRAAETTVVYANVIRHTGMGDAHLVDLAHAIAQTENDADLTAKAAVRAGDIAIGRFEHDRARAYYSEARELYHRVAEHAGEAHCVRNLGVIALRSRFLAAARAMFEQSATLAHAGNDPYGEAISVERLGDVAQIEGNAPEARRYFEDARRRYQAIGHPREADCWLSLAELASATDPQEARSHIEKALKLHRSAGHQLGIANSLLVLGQLESDPVAAERSFKEALPLFRQLGHVRGEANARLLLGHLKNEPPDRRKAVEHFYDALALYRSTGDLNGELEALAGLAIVADADGRPEEAAAFRKEAEALKDLSTSESTGA
jgi:tetratricopeptide (TPR) repeat protein